MSGPTVQALVANIQELQRQLFQVKAEQLPPPVEEDRGDILQGAATQHKLIVVSNRLPVRGEKDRNGDWTFSMSSGGLVTALQGVL